MQTPTNSEQAPAQQALSPAVPVAAPPSIPAVAAVNPAYITFSTALVLCVITAAITLTMALFAPSIAAKRGINLPGVSADNKVVYLDFEQLLAAGMKRGMHSTGGVTDVQAQADKFQSDVSAAMQAYADAGYVVINNKALVVATKTQDITPDVLSALGLKK